MRPELRIFPVDTRRTTVDRRNFFAAAGLAGLIGRMTKHELVRAVTKPLPRRPYRDGVQLSVVGFGGIVLMGMTQDEANDTVALTVDLGVNYFDVAPSYGNGEAEEKMGPALAPFREKTFLACKTMERHADGAERELNRSLARLKTDRFDLYQFHAITRMEEVDAIFAPGGAIESVARAQKEGKVRFVGFSAHSEAAAIAMMDRFAFDSVLFPVNATCWSAGNFGPAIMQHAKEKGVARLALKMLARGPWPEGAPRTYPNAWYQPADRPDEAKHAVRFTLSEDVTAALPPGDITLFRMALDLASDFSPLTAAERGAILDGVRQSAPLFRS
jgi:aryl-alcohol dehydrogenase-like predicted oxidoreductase